MSKIFLCAINNILSGSCPEDCKFCTQSARYHANIERYHLKDIKTILKEAKRAKENGALGYCLVSAGKGLNDELTEEIAKIAYTIKKEIPKLKLIGCNGTATKEQLRYLKSNGIESYNHNLETSKEYYPKICTTHTWEERFQTCENIKEVGLSLCCGGIFGMGESEEDRDSLIDSIAKLSPESIPLNFFVPNQALPIPKRTINYKDALNIIKKTAQKVSNIEILMVAGGRELLFGGKEKEMFEAGANAIVIGDYLTVKGEIPDKDRKLIYDLGFEIAENCNAQ